MAKCIICLETAQFRIKDSSEYYCTDCAKMQFGDTALLVKVDSEAKILKKLIDNDFEIDLGEE